MKLFLLAALTMMAFAANSLLNRAGLTAGGIGAAEFAFVRLASGALMLFALLAIRSRKLPRIEKPNGAAVLGLAAYILGFSFAYVALDAGIGALILFGGVQLTMFGGTLIKGQRITWRKWLGMIIALMGLTVLVWPTEALELPALQVLFMGLAALGWGVYSLIGGQSSDPLADTTWNFIYALPIAGVALVAFSAGVSPAVEGFILAVISGAVTSGLGYALWYRVLPQLGPTTAALAQLSVPVIALAAGVALLDEALSLQAVAACTLICGGIGLGVVRSKSIRALD